MVFHAEVSIRWDIFLLLNQRVRKTAHYAGYDIIFLHGFSYNFFWICHRLPSQTSSRGLESRKTVQEIEKKMVLILFSLLLKFIRV